MSSPVYKEWILQAIDRLRERKARPDLQRICHMAKRKHGLKHTDTQTHLEKLVDAEIVIKVDYKGNTSYRNASKSRKSHLAGQLLNSFTVTKMLTDAVSALTQGQGHGLEWAEGVEKKGASVRDIERWLVSQKLDREELKCPLHVMLQREVDAGRLEKLPNGSYILSPHEPKVGKMKALLKRCESSHPTKRGRPPKKKKMKRFYSYEPPSVATVEPVPRIPLSISGLCDYCQQTSECNRYGYREDLLICKDCTAKAHPTCMEYSKVLAERAAQYPWQCIDCKTCCLCQDSGDADSMLFCDACDKGYHMNCHTPQVLDKPSGKWICSECSDQGITFADIEISSIPEFSRDSNGTDRRSFLSAKCGSTSGLPTPCDSPVSELENSNHRASVSSSDGLRFHDRRLYPDASQWSIDEVVDFFSSIGYRDHADAFREQEIDGQSLLLMKRSDVLTGLSLKLGPALKIYQHVIKLQTIGH